MSGEPVTAAALGEEGSDLADTIGDWFGANLSRWSIGMAKMFRAELPGAIDLYRAVFAEAQSDHDTVCMLTCLVSQGSALIFQGDFAGAQDLARTAIAVGSELDSVFAGAGATIVAFASAAAGDGPAAQEASAAAWQDPFVQRGTVAISCIALSALAAGDLPNAQKLADESVATLLGWHKMWALTIRSFIALAGGDFERAQRDACESLSIGVETGSRLGLPHTLECLAQLAIRAGRHIDGVRLLAAANAVRQRTCEASFQCSMRATNRRSQPPATNLARRRSAPAGAKAAHYPLKLPSAMRCAAAVSGNARRPGGVHSPRQNSTSYGL